LCLPRSGKRSCSSSSADNRRGWRRSRRVLMLALSHRWRNPWLPIST
jgi:hypothetical protein